MLEFEFDLKKLSTKNPKFELHLQVTSSGVNPNKVETKAVLALEKVYNAGISGTSHPDQFALEGLSSNESSFSQNFLLRNLGPSPLEDFQMVFRIPKKARDLQKVIFEIANPETTLNCKESSNGIEHTFNYKEVSKDLPENRTILFNCDNLECVEYTCSGMRLEQFGSVKVQYEIVGHFDELCQYFFKISYI